MEFDKAVAELQTLVETLEREGDERGLYLLELVDAVHRPALELMAAGNFDHPLVRGVLGMYDLADVDEETLVEEALDEVRPYINSHGGEVELLGVGDGVVHLRMSGSCSGCAASAMTLRRGIEATLRERYPGFERVVAEEAEDGAPGGRPLLQIEGLEGVRRPEFVEIEPDGLEPGAIGAREVAGVPVLFVNHEGELYAFRNACPVDGRGLEGARLADGVIVCPWHNCAYDARNGKRVDTEGDGLAVVPIALRDGSIQVAVNVV